MSGCAYGSSSPLGQVMSIAKAFMFLLRVILANKSRLILFGAAVIFVGVLATTIVVVVFSTVVRLMDDMSTELPHRMLQSRHLRATLPACSTQRVLVGLQVGPDLEHSMTLSGTHLWVVHLITNEDPVASDIAAYNARFCAVNGFLVRASIGPEGVCAWDTITTSATVISTAPVSAALFLRHNKWKIIINSQCGKSYWIKTSWKDFMDQCIWIWITIHHTVKLCWKHLRQK